MLVWTEPGARGREGAQGQGGQGRRRPLGTGRAGRGGRRARAGRRAKDGERGAPATRRPAGAVHPPRYPADAGAPCQPPPPPPRAPLHHLPRRRGPGPHQPPRPPYHPACHPHSGAPRGPAPAAREPRAEPARMAAAPAARGSSAAPAPQAQKPQADPARGAEGSRGNWARDWDAVPDPPGGRGPPPGDGGVWVAELRHLRNHQGVEEPALRWRAPPDGQGEPGSAPGVAGGPRGPRKGPPGPDLGGWPDREPKSPAFLEGGAVLRVTDAEANNWLPWALRTALTHWRYRWRSATPRQPQPPYKRWHG